MSTLPPTPPAAPPPSLLRNWLSLLGGILASASCFAAVCLIAIDFFRGFRNPYMGILTYLVAPGFLLAGLTLMALGALGARRRRRRRQPGVLPAYPRLDLNDPRQRRIFFVVAGLTFLFLLLTALGSFRTYEFTDSVMFCGLVCHSIMRPEYTAYQESPHARVACVQCHIGPGATWFVKSKLSGAYQVYATLVDQYPRPIPAPLANLRPAQQTCEQCHWPRKFFGAAVRRHEVFLGDATNAPWVIELLVKIGGGDPSFGPVGGIHWHMNIANRIEYVATDRQRQVIPWVRLTDRQGHVTVYQSKDRPLTPAQVRAATPRVMDCIDCHNRPSHIYRSPVEAVDLALAIGRLDPGLPFIKRQAVRALTGGYTNTPAAREGIAAALTKFYSAPPADMTATNPAAVRQAVAEVQRMYAHYFFPEMKVTWRVYHENLGHLDFVGCFRCHDGAHARADGRTITADCTACHAIVAQGPPGRLDTRLAGLEFKHPDDLSGMWRDMKCTDCHDGATLQ